MLSLFQHEDRSVHPHQEAGKPMSALRDLLSHGLAPSTRQVYRVGRATFERFAAFNRFTPAFPVQFEVLAQFIAASAKETSTAATTITYVTHLRSHHIDRGFATNIFNDERIKRILRGAARKYGKNPVRERLEITKDILRPLLQNLCITHDDINLRAGFCTTFAGFLRMGEFTWSSRDHQSFIHHLSRGSVQFVNGGVILHLPASKMDPFAKVSLFHSLRRRGDLSCHRTTHPFANVIPNQLHLLYFPDYMVLSTVNGHLAKCRKHFFCRSQPKGIHRSFFPSWCSQLCTEGWNFKGGYHANGTVEKQLD